MKKKIYDEDMFKDLSTHVHTLYRKVKLGYSLVSQIATDSPKVSGYLPPALYDVPPALYDQLVALKAKRGLPSVEMAVTVVLSEYFELLQTSVGNANDITTSRLEILEAKCNSLGATVAELRQALVTLQTGNQLVGESEPVTDQSEPLPVLDEDAPAQSPSSLSVDQSELPIVVASSSVSTDKLPNVLPNKALSQAELAQRLEVSASILSRQKNKDGFTEWSQSKDPTGVAWDYDKRLKRFQPKA